MKIETNDLFNFINSMYNGKEKEEKNKKEIIFLIKEFERLQTSINLLSKK